MIELLNQFLSNFLQLSNAMAIYILVGLFFAGVLKQIIPDDFVSKHLGERSNLAVIKATLFGIPLPLCSCSVIPLANSLKKEGASKGAVQSFLISTPITGIDSIMATFGFFGWIFTIYRVISSMIIAICAGIFSNIFDKEDEVLKQEIPKNETKSCCCSGNQSVCVSGSENISGNKRKKFSLKDVFDYAFNTLFGDMAKPLFFGLIAGALFMTFMPKEYANLIFENQYLTYLLIMLLALPLYICATSSLPIAAALMAEGMSPGAGFIFLTAGPATNSVTMGVVYKTLGKKSLIIYMSVISVLSFLFAILLDVFMDKMNITNIVKHHEDLSGIYTLASIIMLLMMGYFLIKPLFKKSEIKSCH